MVGAWISLLGNDLGRCLAFNFYCVFSVFEIALVVVGVAIVGGNGISRDFRLILAADSEPFVYAFL